MKFRCKNEMDQLCFDDSEITSLVWVEKTLTLTMNGAVIKAGNTQNKRYQDMISNEIVLQMKNAELARLVKEGMKYYDADGKLLREIKDEDVPIPAQAGVIERLAKGKIFTVVKDEPEHGYACEFGIDVPQEEDEEEMDTFWLCVTFEESVAEWERYSNPVEE